MKILTIITCLCAAGPSLAQTTVPASNTQSDLTASGFLSLQPGTGSNLPLRLGESLDKPTVGVAIEAVIGRRDGLIVAFDLSTTKPLSGEAGGRAVGPASLGASHRNTVVAVMPGLRRTYRSGQFEAKAGAGLVMGTWSFQDEPVDGVARKIALVCSLGNALRFSERVSLMASFQYIRMFPGDASSRYGFGPNVFRPRIGVRFGL